MKSDFCCLFRSLVLLLGFFVAGAPVIDYFDLTHSACHQGTEAPCEDPADGHCGGLCHMVHAPFINHNGEAFDLLKEIVFSEELSSVPYLTPPPGDIPVPPV